MKLSGLPEVHLMTEAGELAALVDILSRERIIAVDTESNSLHAYQEQVCLIQFSTEEQDYLVDPLALRDMSSLGPIFASPEIEKVFHAAEYDLLCLKRDFGFRFENLFDTMLAASILGRDEIGLGSILKSEFGVELDKRFQRANWGQRPLPPQLLAYARLDTHFLIQLRNRLKKALEERGRWPLAEEDFRRLDQVSTGDLETAGDSLPGEAAMEVCGRMKGVHELSPQQIAILLELCRYRDQVARTLDRPLFKVFNDDTLLAVAMAKPASLNELRYLPGMSKGQVHRHGQALIQAVERGRKAPPISLPRAPRPDERFLNRLDRLRQWRKETARQMGVKSDVILSRDLLHDLAEQNPQDPARLAGVLADIPWRLERFGEQILMVLKNGRP